MASYNIQNDKIIYGLEADLGQSSASGFMDFPGDQTKGAYHTDVSEGWNGHVRARLGFASDNLLFFAAGGLALAQFDYGYNWPPDPNQIYHGRALYPGLSLGGGVDYAVSDSVTLRAEYIYDNFSAHRFIFQGTGALSYYRAIDDVTFTTHTVRVGVAYKF